jgi:hypothetical protein
MDEKGLIVTYLEKLFGRSWHTSLTACLVAIPQIISAIQAAGLNIGIPTSTLNGISIVAAAVGLAMAKSQSVSGANRTETTGVSGPAETGKDPLCEEKGGVRK